MLQNLAAVAALSTTLLRSTVKDSVVMVVFQLHQLTIDLVNSARNCGTRYTRQCRYGVVSSLQSHLRLRAETLASLVVVGIGYQSERRFTLWLGQHHMTVDPC